MLPGSESQCKGFQTKRGAANENRVLLAKGLLGSCLGPCDDWAKHSLFPHSGLDGCNSLTNSLHCYPGHFLVTNGKDRFPICSLTNGLIKCFCSHTQKEARNSHGRWHASSERSFILTLLISRQVREKVEVHSCLQRQFSWTCMEQWRPF